MSSRERQQADLERWAANFLSAPPEDAAAVRSRFLQLVDQQNCFPAQDVSLALEVLTGQIKPDPGQPSQGLVWSLVEDEIGQDVDRFACDFFALDRAERRQR